MSKKRKRINITIPEDTLELVDRIREENRSEFINRALKVYVNRLERSKLKKQLKQAYQERAKEDLATVREWEPVERELWEKLEQEE